MSKRSDLQISSDVQKPKEPLDPKEPKDPKDPKPKPIVPRPVTISALTMDCDDENDPLSSDEPYLLVFSLNLVGLPKPRVIKLGPFNVSASDTTFVFPPNILWGVDGQPTIINHPDDLLLLVALMENDTSDPEAVRSFVEGFMVASSVEHATSAGNHNDFASRMINAMQGFISAPALATGPIDPDDQIGPVQELRINQDDLNLVYSDKLNSSDKAMVFAGDGARYFVRFRIH